MEHAVDLDSGAIVGCTVQPGAAGDTITIHETIFETVSNLVSIEEHAGTQGRTTREWVADKGYHSNETLLAIQSSKGRSYISEPNRGRRRWTGKEAEREAVYGNRRRMRTQHGRALYKKRSELTERSFAHCLDTAGMRRVHLRGRKNI